MERESIPHDGNSQQSFAALPLKPNGQRKTRVRTTESHPIQQSPGMNRLREFPAEPSGTRHCSQIDGDMHPVDQNLGANWNPRTAAGGDRIRAGGPRSSAASPQDRAPDPPRCSQEIRCHPPPCRLEIGAEAAAPPRRRPPRRSATPQLLQARRRSHHAMVPGRTTPRLEEVGPRRSIA
jgi:hypothetical protein